MNIRALQDNRNVARNEAILNGETQTKHPISTYTDNEKRWLVTIADDEWILRVYIKNERSMR